MNTPRYDWADFVALECLASVHALTVAQSTAVIAEALRNAKAKGYADGRKTLTERMVERAPGPGDPAMLEYARRLGRSSVRSPRELRDRSRFDDCQRETQADHDDTVLAGHPGFSGSGA